MRHIWYLLAKTPYCLKAMPHHAFIQINRFPDTTQLSPTCCREVYPASKWHREAIELLVGRRISRGSIVIWGQSRPA